MEQKDYSKLLPTVPPEGLVEYTIAHSKKTWNAMVVEFCKIRNPLTEQLEKMAKITCSACGHTEYAGIRASQCSSGGRGFWNDFTQKAVHCHSEITICPNCGETVKTIEAVKQTSREFEYSWCMSVTTVENRLVLMGWRISRHVDDQGVTIDKSQPYETYVVEDKKLVRLSGWYSAGFGNRFMTDKWEHRKKCTVYWKYADLVFPWNPEILEQTTAKNCRLDKFMKLEDPCAVGYLWLWVRNPVVETMVEQGGGRFLNNEIEKGTASDGHGVPKLDWNWKAKRPCELLGLSKTEFSSIIEKWDETLIRMFVDLKKRGYQPKVEDVEALKLVTIYFIRRIENWGENPLRVARMLLREKRAGRKYAEWLVEDYWRMAQDLGMNLEKTEVRYPPRLEIAHDWALKETNRIKDEKKALEQEQRKVRFEAIVKEIEPFSWSDGTFCIFPAKSEKELIYEGRTLNHCVGGYGEEMASGRKRIFFLRKESDREAPWFTVTVSKNYDVLVNLGKRNCSPPEYVNQFVEKWANWAKAKKNKEEKARKRQRKVEVA